jgi:hypothetical protein
MQRIVYKGAKTAMKKQRILALSPASQEIISQHAPLLTDIRISRRRWEDNIKMDIQEVGCGGMDWIELAQVRDRWRTLLAAVMSLRVP